MSTSLSMTQEQWLDVRESEAVLGQALAAKVPIQLTDLDAPDAIVWRGTLHQANEDALILASSDRLSEFPPDWHDTRLRATFCAANRVYVFETKCLAAGSAGTIHVMRPPHIERVERRRAPRRRFQTTTVVRLYAEPRAQVPFEGLLLNLSTHGLACRISASASQATPVSSTIRAAFDLGPHDKSFEFDADVVSVTPNGSGEAILGIEFLDNPKRRAQRDQLASALSMFHASFDTG